MKAKTFSTLCADRSALAPLCTAFGSVHGIGPEPSFQNPGSATEDSLSTAAWYGGATHISIACIFDWYHQIQVQGVDSIPF